MSVQSMSLVFEHSRSEGKARLVLLSIANHDGEGGAWPSIETLAREARTSESTVHRSIRDLVALGELVVHRNDGGTHKTRADRRPNRYEITLEPAPQDAETAPSDGVPHLTPREPERGATHDTPSSDHGVSPTSPRGVIAVTPEPSLTIQDPPSPAADAAGATGCAAHPDGKPNCRHCGTTPRQLNDAAKRDDKRRRRDEQLAQQARDRDAAAAARRNAPPPSQAVQLARQGIASSKASLRKAAAAS